MDNLLRFFIIFLCCIFYVLADYEVPEATVEVYTPKGLSVSIPDGEGIKLFAFHGKINEEMNGREAGTFSRDITKAKNGKWTFYDSQAKLQVGDVLYYWTFVDYFDGERKLGYVKDDQSFTVKELLPKPGVKPPDRPVTPTIGTSTIKTPSDPNTCEKSLTTIRNQSACKNQLIFDSRFNEFNSNKDTFWTIQRKFASAPDYEFVLYEDNPKTLSIENGHLTVSPLLTDQIYGDGFVTKSDGFDIGQSCTGIAGTAECYQRSQGWYIIPPVISSQISSKGKFSFKYGRIEIRAKLPKGDWLYPELYLNPELEEYGPNYESGQIRIAFTPGNIQENKKLTAGIILGQKQAARNYFMKIIESRSGWSDDFHVFNVLWTPEEITCSVDGMIFGTIYPPVSGFASLGSSLQLPYAQRWKQGTNMAPFDKEMHIVIGVGAGGHNFDDRSDGSKPWSNKEPKSQKNFYNAHTTWSPTWSNGNGKLDVDYVKIWAI